MKKEKYDKIKEVTEKVVNIQIAKNRDNYRKDIIKMRGIINQSGLLNYKLQGIRFVDEFEDDGNQFGEFTDEKIIVKNYVKTPQNIERNYYIDIIGHELVHATQHNDDITLEMSNYYMDTFEVDKIVQQAEIEAYAFNIILEMEQDNVSFEECYYTKTILKKKILSEKYYPKLKNEISEYFISSKYDYDELYVNGMWN